jgi:hypothetical protein
MNTTIKNDNLYLCSDCFTQLMNAGDNDNAEPPVDIEEVPFEQGADCEGYECKGTAEYLCSFVSNPE